MNTKRTVTPARARTAGRPAAKKTLRPAPLPNLLEIKRILVPTDFSKESLKGIRYAAALAAKFEATIELVFVLETTSYVAGLNSSLLALTDIDAAQQASQKLAALATKEIPNTLSAFPRVRIGHGANEICAAAKAYQADLIVISTHGYTGLKHTLLGSTAERVVRYAPCPVLVVREREHEFITKAPTTE